VFVLSSVLSLSACLLEIAPGSLSMREPEETFQGRHGIPHHTTDHGGRTVANVEYVDLTQGQFCPTTGDSSREQVHVPAGPNKRKFSSSEEECSVIGRLKRVQLMERGQCRESTVAAIRPTEREGSRVALEYPCPGEDAQVNEEERFGDPTSEYEAVNRMLGDAHREMLGRKQAFSS
jgi:hypothetical protein